MRNVDLIVKAKYILPVVPHDSCIEDGVIVVNEGRILHISSVADLKEEFNAKETLEFNESIIIPGLINSHTHAGMSHMRGMAEDLKLAEWLAHEIWPAEAKFTDFEFTRDGTELAVAEMIKGGTTCFVDMYFFTEAAREIVEASGIRAVLATPLLDFPTNYARDFDEYLAKTRNLIENSKPHELIRHALGPHAPYTVSDAHLVRAMEVAKEFNVPFNIHLHETKNEVDDSANGTESMSKHRSTHNLRPLANFDRLGLVNSSLIAVHMTQLTDEEISLLAEKKAHVVHCPESNLKLASGFCPVQKLLSAGVNVALGTDSTASNNDLSMLGEMRTAAMLGKMVANDASAMKGDTVLRMATLNGAKSVNWDNEIGSLEVGKSADFTVIDASPIEFHPFYEPIYAVTYCASPSQVTDVWVKGRRLLKDKKLTTIDEEDLKRRVSRWNKALWELKKQKKVLN